MSGEWRTAAAPKSKVCNRLMLAPGKWTINDNGELTPDDDKAKAYEKSDARQKAQSEDIKTFYCLFERAASR